MPKKFARPLNPSADLAQLVYERYDKDLQRFLLRRSDGGASTARDLAQEVYLRLLRVEKPKLLRNPQGYMYTIASHVVYENLLKAEVEPIDFDSEQAADLDTHPTELPADPIQERAGIENELKVILDQLPKMYRTIFLLHKRDGWSYVEVAQKLDISVHTVKKYLYRALAQLREIRLERRREEPKP